MCGHTRERRVDSGAGGKTAKTRMTAKAQATAKVRTTGRERCGVAALYATGSGGDGRGAAARRRKRAVKVVRQRAQNGDSAAQNGEKTRLDGTFLRACRIVSESGVSGVKPYREMFHKKTTFCGQNPIDTYILLCYHCVALFGRDDKFRPEILKFDREKGYDHQDFEA